MAKCEHCKGSGACRVFNCRNCGSGAPHVCQICKGSGNVEEA